MPFLILEQEIDLLACEARVAPFLAPSEDSRAVCCTAGDDPFDMLLGGAEPPADMFPYGRPGQPGPCTIYSPLHTSRCAGEAARCCYREALRSVAERAFTTVAFPLIADDRGEDWLHIAAFELGGFAREHPDVTLLLSVPDRASALPDSDLLADVEAYIREVRQIEQRLQAEASMLEDASTCSFPVITDEQLRAAGRKAEVSAPKAPQSAPEQGRKGGFSLRNMRKDGRAGQFKAPAEAEKRRSVFDEEEFNRIFRAARADADKPSDKEKAGQLFSLDSFNPKRDFVLEESFSETVLRLIDEKRYTPSQFYNKANVDKRVFSRLRCDANYHPTKTTAVAYVVALELPLNEANDLLRKAGYSLSHSILSDVIVEYFILHRQFDVYAINEILYYKGLPLLGVRPLAEDRA